MSRNTRFIDRQGAGLFFGFFIAAREEIGHDGPGNIVPYAEDSPRDCRSCTEVEHGKGSSKAAVLHANLNGNSLGFGDIHLQKLADGKAAGGSLR